MLLLLKSVIHTSSPWTARLPASTSVSGMSMSGSTRLPVAMLKRPSWALFDVKYRMFPGPCAMSLRMQPLH